MHETLLQLHPRAYVESGARTQILFWIVYFIVPKQKMTHTHRRIAAECQKILTEASSNPDRSILRPLKPWKEEKSLIVHPMSMLQLFAGSPKLKQLPSSPPPKGTCLRRSSWKRASKPPSTGSTHWCSWRRPRSLLIVVAAKLGARDSRCNVERLPGKPNSPKQEASIPQSSP